MHVCKELRERSRRAKFELDVARDVDDVNHDIILVIVTLTIDK